MSLDSAILGFLSLRSMSGYELKKAFDQSVGHFWTADQAQIYRTLARLEKRGQVAIERVAQDGRPDRKDHHLTEAGQKALDEWLGSKYQSVPSREPFLLRVFFAGRLGREAVQELMADHLNDARQQLSALEEVAQQVAAELAGQNVDLAQRLRLETLHNGIAHTRAEIEWASRVAKELAAEEAEDAEDAAKESQP